MRKIIIIFCLIAFSKASGQNTGLLDSMIDSRTKSLSTNILELKNIIETEKHINDKTFNSISTQISAASLTLTIMSIAFAIVAILVGIYVTYVERKIIKIGEENRKLLTENRLIKKDVDELNEMIQSDIKGLYTKLKRQETLDLLERLQKVPKDIFNVCELLLSRELQINDFDILKQAYKKLNSTDNSYKERYKLLFFQHFLTNTMKDDELRKEILDYIPYAIRAAFENDILKSSHDFIVGVIDRGLHNFKDEVNMFFAGLSSSEHKSYDPVYLIMFDTLKTRQNRFDFLNLIDSTKETRIAKIAFGNLLIKEYAEFQPTEIESLAIQEINKLEQLKNMGTEEEKQKENPK